MIPDFGQPLPPVQATPNYPAPAGQPDYSKQGFTTYRAPDSAAPATPLTPPRSYAPLARQPSQSNTSLESRIVRLEQLAFGSTYPEHELDDRVDHLDSEVFGKAGSGDLSSRLAKLEGKLGGQGAFGQGGQPPPSPVVATSWGPDTIQGGPATRPTSYNAAGPGSDYDSSSQQPKPNNSYAAAQPVAPARDRPVSGQQQVAIAKPQGIAPPYGTTTSSAGGTFDFQSTVNAIPFDSRAGDYFPQIRKGPNGTVARWTKFPVRVHVPPGSPQSWQSSLESGVKKWSQYLPIVIAGSNEGADIEVVWINHLPPNELGITRVQVQRGVLQSVIYLLRPTYYLPDVPERALAGVFLHEMGHGLGIFGHSDFKDDLMQPIEISMVGRKRGANAKYKFGNITARDVNTLKHIYQSPTVPPDFTSPQPTDWNLQSVVKR
jgi:predicted Zn-dependent protease